MNRSTVALTSVSLLATLAACSDDDSAAPAATSPSAVPTSADGERPGATTIDAEVDCADLAFARMMIPHHDQAVQMADIALDPGRQAAPEIVDLALRIKAAQSGEVAKMTVMLEAGNASQSCESRSVVAADGRMSAQEMRMLDSARAPELDRMWMVLMLEHHEGAIRLMETAMRDGINATSVEIAQSIIARDRAEIDELRTLLDG